MTTISSHIILNENKTFDWISKNNIHFIGYFFDSKQGFINGDKAIKHFEYCTDLKDLKNRIAQANGIFSVIIKNDDVFFLASDKSRFFPVFYYQTTNNIYISDSIYELIRKQHSPTFDSSAKAQFLSGAFVTGNRTLIKHVFQVQAGEILELKINKTVSSSFSSIIHKPIINKKNRKKEKGIKNCFKDVGEKLADSIGKRNVLLPLSGGYDSRLIACWLKMNNISNVTCFTFGRKGTTDIEISKQIAKKLNFEWHYIEYNNENVKHFLNDPEFDNFYKYMSRGTSMFYMQEYFALKQLVGNSIIDKSFVAIPGHSGDVLGGSQLYKMIPSKLSLTNADKLILKKVFYHSNHTKVGKKNLRNELAKQLLLLKQNRKNALDYSIFEEWIIREKLAKYIINSAHVFTYFGVEVRLPFWDDELVSLWLNLPLEKRLYNRYYNSFLESNYFTPLGVNFKTKLQPTYNELFWQKVKGNVRPYLPLKMKRNLLKKNDWVLYDQVTQGFLSQLDLSGFEVKDTGASYLNRILNWYLMKIEQEYFT